MIQKTNPWVGYADRSYQQILNKLLNWRLPVAAPELTDRSQNNPFIVLVDMFSGLSEMLNYSIDSYARERFLATAQEYKSVVDLVKPLDYRIKANLPESVDILFTITPISTQDILIPTGTALKSTNGNFRTTQDLLIKAGTSNGVVGAKQWDLQSNILVGITDNSMNQMIYLGNKYVHNTDQLTIGGEIYREVPTFAYSKSDDKVFIVEVDKNKEPYAVLGDGISGSIPPEALPIYLDMYVTNQVKGVAPINSITSLVTAIPLPDGITLTMTNPTQSSGGAGIESIEQIRKNAPIAHRTIERAVTYYDYLELISTFPSVGKVAITPSCGNSISVIVAPISNQVGGGIASKALLQDVYDFITDKTLIGTNIDVYAAGISILNLEITLTPSYRQDGAKAVELARTTLLTKYGYDNSKINQNIRVSDIYALVDNLQPVDFINIESLSLIPYPAPYNHDNQLNWVVEILSTSISKSDYTVTYTGNGFLISRNGVFMSAFAMFEEYSDQNIKLYIKNPVVGAYATGNGWSFSTYPYNKDLVVNDNSIPTLLSENLIVNLAKQLETTTINCK